MSKTWHVKVLRAATVLALLAGLLSAGAAGAATKRPILVLGPNLVVNPGFEQSTLDAATANGIPVMPVGWTFEGATLTFDYNERGGAHSGKRNAGLSGSLAPGRQICDASSGSYVCEPNPAYAATSVVNDAAIKTFSVRPYYVTQNAIQVTPGKTYRFSMWSFRPSLAPDAGPMGEGAQSKVRWLDASGSTISVVDGSSCVKTAKRQISYLYTFADLVPPPGAVGAKLLLGFTDFTTTSGAVAFDDIGFQQVLHG